MEISKLPELVRPFSWLLGKWTCTNGVGKYPTIADFRYHDVIEFKQCGMQPLLSYEARSKHPEKGNPMHLESGFLRGRAGGEVSFMVAHNFGLTSLEEGTVQGNEIRLKSQQVARMSGSKDPQVLGIERLFKLEDENTLKVQLWMNSSTTPEMTEHLVATYSKAGMLIDV